MNCIYRLIWWFLKDKSKYAPPTCSLTDEAITEKHGKSLEYKRRLETQLNTAINAYEKIMLTINTGAIVVSFTYVMQIGGQKYNDSLDMFKYSLILFVSSITMSIIGYYTSCVSIEKAIDINDLSLSSDCGKLVGYENWKLKCMIFVQKCRGIIIDLTNPLQLFLTIMGLVLLTIFFGTSIVGANETKATYCTCQNKEILMKEKDKMTTPNKPKETTSKPEREKKVIKDGFSRKPVTPDTTISSLLANPGNPQTPTSVQMPNPTPTPSPANKVTDTVKE